MDRRGVVSTAVLSAILLLPSSFIRQAAAQDPNWKIRGRWTSQIPNWQSNISDSGGTHVAILRGAADTTWALHWHDGNTERLWWAKSGADTSLGIPVPLDPSVRLFCAGHTQLADGRLLVVGGTTVQHTGLGGANIFDPKTFRQDSNHGWTQQRKMNFGRWYPTATLLGDGRVLVGAGWRHFQMVMFGGRHASGVSMDLRPLNLSSDPAPLWNADPTSSGPEAREGQAATLTGISIARS